MNQNKEKIFESVRSRPGRRKATNEGFLIIIRLTNTSIRTVTRIHASQERVTVDA